MSDPGRVPATVLAAAVRETHAAVFRSPTNPSVQVSLVSGDATAPEQSLLSVNVNDVDAAHAEAQRRGYEIVHPLIHEPRGVRRFFVRDPHGIVVNIVGHAD